MMTKTDVAAHFGISRMTLNAALERPDTRRAQLRHRTTSNRRDRLTETEFRKLLWDSANKLRRTANMRKICTT